MRIITLITCCFIFIQGAFAQTMSEEIELLKSYVEAENVLEAIALADKLIADKVKEGNETDAAKVYMYRGIAKHQIEIDEDAIVDLKVAVTLDSKLRQSYYYIAEIYYTLSNFSSALENIIYYLDTYPEDVLALAIKGKSELKLGEVTAAKLTIQKAISIKSSEPQLYYIRAVINRELGEDKLACKDATIAVKFGYTEAQNFLDSHCTED